MATTIVTVRHTDPAGRFLLYEDGALAWDVPATDLGMFLLPYRAKGAMVVMETTPGQTWLREDAPAAPQTAHPGREAGAIPADDVDWNALKGSLKPLVTIEAPRVYAAKLLVASTALGDVIRAVRREGFDASRVGAGYVRIRRTLQATSTVDAARTLTRLVVDAIGKGTAATVYNIVWEVQPQGPGAGQVERGSADAEWRQP